MADYTYLSDAGVIVADTSTVQASVESEFKSALGADLVTTANTPGGVLITAETLARSEVLKNNAALANQINPNLAGGVFLDAIVALTGGQRSAASYSVITGVELTGLAGTVIPAGSLASLADGTQFASVSSVTLDGSGSGVVDFQAVDLGPIAAASGALTQVVSAILGWDSVTNPNAATLGRNIESDQALRMKRKNTLSLQNVALPEAITSALYAVQNVKSLAFRENPTGSSATIDGITLVKNSVWACVQGGTDGDIAAALLANKSMGCNWNGSTTVSVVDSASGQAYSVKFDRPTAVPVQARVTVRNIGAVTNVPATVRSAVLAYAAGEVDGEAGFTVGSDVSPFELAGAVNIQAPGLFVTKLEVSYVSTTSWVTTSLDIALNEIATITEGAIEVIVL